MLGFWTPLVALVGTLLPLLWVKRWITRLFQELSMRWVGDADVALVLYFVLVLPGVLIHELSHWLAARLLGVRVTGFSLGPKRTARSKRVSLGYIRVSKVDPVRASLIGLAPLLTGSAAILLIGYLVLGVGDLAATTSGQGLEVVLAGLKEVLRVPDFWIWFYLIFAISNAMLPSYSDMHAVRPVLIFLAIATVMLLVVGGVPSIPVEVARVVSDITRYLASSFAVTLAVDLLVVLVMGLLLLTTRWLQR
jgi:hypothetical protein